MWLILKNWQRLSNNWAYLAASMRNVPQIAIAVNEHAPLSQIISLAIWQAHRGGVD
ncbi:MULTISPECIES: hypothetical protein [Yersinia pseudotuberculosis complex]|uniref:hypothetical protein n=1 Tax=Yersinia pseudotuberculosis complex TaxID=1649845 RepID=UPI00042627A7|nr:MULTISPECIES: hypothetical protein [Yersinia pseudotuberculosis complex]